MQPPPGGVPPSGYGPPAGYPLSSGGPFVSGPTAAGPPPYRPGSTQQDSGGGPGTQPPRGGGGGGVVFLAGVAIALGVVLGGGAVAAYLVYKAKVRQADESSASASEDPAPVAPPAPTTTFTGRNDFIYGERPPVKFLPPFGWKKEMSRDREWAVFTAPGEDAVLAFSTFNQPGESTKRLAKGAATLGATNPDWRAPHWGSVGKDQFPAHVAEGECYFKGPNGFIWYATVNAGTADQILMMFTVSAAAPRSRRSEAQASIETLQRR